MSKKGSISGTSTNELFCWGSPKWREQKICENTIMWLINHIEMNVYLPPANWSFQQAILSKIQTTYINLFLCAKCFKKIMLTISVQPLYLELYLVNIALQPLTPRHVMHFYYWDLLDEVYMCILCFFFIFIEKTMQQTIPTSFNSIASKMSD